MSLSVLVITTDMDFYSVLKEQTHSFGDIHFYKAPEAPSEQDIDIIVKKEDKAVVFYHQNLDQDVGKQELPCRVGEIIDRIYHIKNTALKKKADNLELNIQNIFFYPRELSLVSEDGKSVRLTEKERDFLLALFTAPENTLDRQILLEKVWEYAQSAETHTLETHVYRLRQKLGQLPFLKDPLLTGENGYTLVV